MISIYYTLNNTYGQKMAQLSLLGSYFVQDQDSMPKRRPKLPTTPSRGSCVGDLRLMSAVGVGSGNRAYSNFAALVLASLLFLPSETCSIGDPSGKLILIVQRVTAKPSGV